MEKAEVKISVYNLQIISAQQLSQAIWNPGYFDTQILNFGPVGVRRPVDGLLGYRGGF